MRGATRLGLMLLVIGSLRPVLAETEIPPSAIDDRAALAGGNRIVNKMRQLDLNQHKT